MGGVNGGGVGEGVLSTIKNKFSKKDSLCMSQYPPNSVYYRGVSFCLLS